MKRLVLILTWLWHSCSALAAGQVVEEIVTRVNGQIITRSEFQRSKDQLRDDVKQQDPANADKLYADREKDVLRDLIDQQLLLEKGKDLGITGDTDLIKRLDQMRKDMKLETMEELEKAATSQGISYEDFKQNMRNQIITQKVIGEEVGSHLSITKDEEQQFYDEHKNEMEQPESIKLSEILIAPQKPAADKASAGKPRFRTAPRRLPNAPMPPPATPPNRLRRLRLWQRPKPKPTMCSSRFAPEPTLKTWRRNIPTALRRRRAAIWECSSAALSPKNWKTERSP